MKLYRCTVGIKMINNEGFQLFIHIPSEQEPTLEQIIQEIFKSNVIKLNGNMAIMTSCIMQISLIDYYEEKGK